MNSKDQKEVTMFAPIIVWIRKWLGKSQFNRLRSKLIALHIQVITQVSNGLGINLKCRQHLIHVAHENGKKLGLLA